MGIGQLPRIAVSALSLLASAMVMAQSASETGYTPDADSYWHRPLAAQGTPPKNWTPLEQSLAPEDCGQCHIDKLTEWRSSRHAKAFSAGLVGQLLTFSAEDTALCLECHAPLAEQDKAFESARATGRAHVTHDQGLAAKGNSCGGCHVRHYARFGPPQRETKRVGHSIATEPHGGVFRTKLFESSAFCSACHQFPESLAINGKPLENTYIEWKASPQAAAGKTCQVCHMPDRQHLWRGIHDPAMVASGLEPKIVRTARSARFSIRNTGVGHAFPTYVTPKVVMNAVALDNEGREIPDSRRSRTIERSVRFDGNQWIEISDTRLMPGQSASLDIGWPKSGRIRVWLEVFPDNYYETQVYPSILAGAPRNSEAAKLIAMAKEDASHGSFRLFQSEVHIPSDKPSP